MERSWKWRRAMVFSVAAACIVLLFAALFIGGNDLVTQAIVQGAYLTLVAVVGGYLGIAMWDDRNKGKEILSGISERVGP
ncbi:hypothetical protein [Rhizobium sp. SGZ-381]|uniref:hypothetical protein n=1 Tax=Rhizobium sp. SGZ-381 TaxID=3342800 RepID=UPI00366EA57E